MGYRGLTHGITKRSRDEEAAIQTNEEWERTFNSIPDLIAILDDKYQIVRINKAMADRLGLINILRKQMICGY